MSLVHDLKQHGDIQLITGPMFAGKSTELIRRVRKYIAAKQRVVVIKYADDTRYAAEELATHDQSTYPAIKTTKLSDIGDSIIRDVEVIAVDEGQFYPDIVEYAEKWANSKKTVIISALDGTWQRKPFQTIALLQSVADYVDKLSAVCYKCQSTASFSGRISDEDQEIVIGGADKYVACCRSCWLELNRSK